MKKSLKALSLVALVATTMTVQGKILRVNNVAGMAPYTSIQAAVDASQYGDTIMVDGSTIAYEGVKLNKRLVLVGPGYFQKENKIETVATMEAIVGGITVETAGCTIIGMHVRGEDFCVAAPQTVITRCRKSSWGDFYFKEGADNCIIHQNFIGTIGRMFCTEPTSNHQITNNIMSAVSFDWSGFRNSYIAYNTSSSDDRCAGGTSGCTYEHNLVGRWWNDEDTENTYNDNFVFWDYSVDFRFADTDLEVYNRLNQSLPEGVTSPYGALAGDDPYVMSGIPAGPVIERLTVPASVEEGSKLNITIKLGQQ